MNAMVINDPITNTIAFKGKRSILNKINAVIIIVGIKNIFSTDFKVFWGKIWILNLDRDGVIMPAEAEKKCSPKKRDNLVWKFNLSRLLKKQSYLVKASGKKGKGTK